MPEIPKWVWVVAVSIVLAIVLIIVIASVYAPNSSRAQEGTVTLTSNGTQSATGSVSIEGFRAPAKSNYIGALTAHGWNALVTTYKVPGAVSKYKQVSGTATFSMENGESLILTLTWLTDSQVYDFTNWRLNASMNAFTVDYADDNSGYVLNATIEQRSKTRYDVSVYDDENNLKRLIILTV